MKAIDIMYIGYKNASPQAIQPSDEIIEARKMCEEQYMCLHNSLPADLLHDLEMYSAMMQDLIAQYRKDAFAQGFRLGLQFAEELKGMDEHD